MDAHAHAMGRVRAILAQEAPVLIPPEVDAQIHAEFEGIPFRVEFQQLGEKIITAGPLKFPIWRGPAILTCSFSFQTN